MQKTHIKKLQGFSIIELTIVLIVIGLMTSAVLVGAKLISEAKIRQLSTLLSETENAIYGFKMQYTYLPGDFPNASKQWSIAELNEKCRLDNNGTLTDFDSSSSVLVNGNGSTLVENDGKVPDAGVAWCHLVLAKLVKKSEVLAASALQYKQDSTFLPNGLFYNTNNSLYLIGSGSETKQYDIGNHIYLFGRKGSNSASPFAPSNTNLTARELAAIDSKLDDGKPGSGRITMFSKDNSIGKKVECCNDLEESRCKTTSKYKATDNTKNACYMRYSSGFFN